MNEYELEWEGYYLQAIEESERAYQEELADWHYTSEIDYWYSVIREPLEEEL